jgi:hypothetical protein
MKLTLHKLIALLLFAGSYLGANAQAVPDTMRVNIGLEGGLPLNDRYKSVLGVSLRIDYPIARKTYITGTAGYNKMFAASTPQLILNVPNADLQTVPLKIGIKQFVIRHFYVLGEVGQTLLLNKTQAFATKSSSLTFSPQIGMLFFLKNRTYIDAGIRHEILNSFNNDNEKFNFWAAHIAYAFNL